MRQPAGIAEAAVKVCAEFKKLTSEAAAGIKEAAGEVRAGMGAAGSHVSVTLSNAFTAEPAGKELLLAGMSMSSSVERSSPLVSASISRQARSMAKEER